MSHVPKSITIPAVVLFLLGAFTMVVGAMLTPQVVVAGITIIMGGLSGIIMGLGLRMGRLRVLSAAYITSMLAILIAILIYTGGGLSSILVIGLPAFVVYAFVMRMLFSEISTEYCLVQGSDPPTLREIFDTLSPKRRQASPMATTSGVSSHMTSENDAVEPLPNGTPTNQVDTEETGHEPFVSWKDVLGYDRDTVPETPVSVPEEKDQWPTTASVSEKTEESVNGVDAIPSDPTEESERVSEAEKTVNQPEAFRYCIGCGFDLHRLPRTANHCPKCGIEIMWGDEQ